jgi:hypothetical protein
MRCKYCQCKIKLLYGSWVIDIPLDEKARIARGLGGKEIYDTASRFCNYNYLTTTSRCHWPLEDSIVTKVLNKYGVGEAS